MDRWRGHPPAMQRPATTVADGGMGPFAATVLLVQRYYQAELRRFARQVYLLVNPRYFFLAEPFFLFRLNKHELPSYLRDL